ncbi:MAG: hypothetical protein KZQ99_04465 [Candidatus Thiodiazotropha sp. (ex Dulcina madagascariensis)]|nr:hypothetical protein [Candidatus Thiodiazotropha sp. (ex Dulcina madagascariensis)]
MKNVPLPTGELRGDALREAATGEFRQIQSLLQDALKQAMGLRPDQWVDIHALFADRVVVADGSDSRFYVYPYTLNDSNQVELGDKQEVVPEYNPVFREAQSGIFVEAMSGSKFRIRVIRAGLSGNKTLYPDAVLREAAPLFDGVRVFVKSDEEHLKGKGKDFRNLIGRLTNPRFVEGKGKDSGEIQADLELLDAAEVTPKLREAVERNMADDLFGFSIDADGKAKKKRGFREALTITRVQSVDLIIEPGAGGQIIKLIEAMKEDTDVALRERMIEAVKTANNGNLPEGLDVDDDEALEAAYREALTPTTTTDDKSQGADGNAHQQGQGGAGAQAGVSLDDVDERIRMMEARSNARITIAGCGLPDAARAKLLKQFSDENATFTEAEVEQAISDERAYLAKFTESGHVQGLGGDGGAQAGQDRSEKIVQMLDDFFDPSKPAMSFKECYVEITGDKGVTGLMQHVDRVRLREAVGDADFREAINASTFANDILGDSITRALLRDYRTEDMWSDWRWLADVVPVGDFRTQERTRMGGYGDLPTVLPDDPYNALTSPTGEKAQYALSKRGGTETINLEAVANDDVGVIARVPQKMSQAAKRTLYKFIFDFLRTNPVIYDSTALYTVGHGNLGTAALDPTSFAAARLSMSKQVEMDSGEPLGLVLRHFALPSDLIETAFDMFVRNTNNDETFVQSRKPMVHEVPYWTDTNDWVATADKSEAPLFELGFYNGQEEPELFVQDQPNQGSLFSNDQIKYKIRHIYSGVIPDYRPHYKSVVA